MADKMLARVRVRNGKGEKRTFWRCGFKFHPEWENFELTPDQLERIIDETMLEAEEIKGLSAAEVIDRIKELDSVDDILELTAKDSRKTVRKAADKRIAKIQEAVE